MRSILYVTSSPRGALSWSRRIGDEWLALLCAADPGRRVIARHLADEPPPLIDAAFSAAILAPPASPPAPALAGSESLVQELEATDALVIATPMHNFGVPAVLKAWIDQVVRINRTFRATPAGKVGLLADRPAFLVVASGGWFSGPTLTGAPAQPDFVTGYIRAVLMTIGIVSLRVVTLEGVTRGAEQAVTRAREAMRHWPVQGGPWPHGE